MAMTHGERFDRRRALAKEVADGATPAEVAARHGLSDATVRSACREQGVVMRALGSSKVPVTGYVILFALLKGESVKALAKRLECTTQYVYQVIASAEEAGFQILAGVRQDRRRKDRKDE